MEAESIVPENMKFCLGNVKELNFFNLVFKLAEGKSIQLSTVKISFRTKSSFLRYEVLSKKVEFDNFEGKKKLIKF